MPDPPLTNPWSWNPRNLGAIALVVLGLGLLAGWRLWRSPARLNGDLSVEPASLAPAAERIDLNTANWASLARLPGIGGVRARRIVAWRERFVAEHPGQPAFTRPQDLQQVEGIGPAIVEQVAPFLEFGPSP